MRHAYNSLIDTLLTYIFGLECKNIFHPNFSILSETYFYILECKNIFHLECKL